MNDDEEDNLLAASCLVQAAHHS